MAQNELLPAEERCTENFKGHVCTKAKGHGPGHRCFVCNLVWTSRPKPKDMK